VTGARSLATAGGQPGDWFVVDPGGDLFRWIELGERLIDGRRAKGERWGHAGIATRWADNAKHTRHCPALLTPGEQGLCDCGAPPARTLMIVEAEPGGAVEVPWHWENRPHLWSAGTGLSSPAMANAAQGYIGTGYSFLDYAAIAAHAGHLWAPGLKGFIASTHHQICSQLVDQCAQDKGIHLYDDCRWPGFVTPLDLGLLLARRA
jgi:hypothetical protein